MRAIYLAIVLMGLTLNLWAVEGTTCRVLFDPVLVGPSQAEAELDRQLQAFKAEPTKDSRASRFVDKVEESQLF